MDRPPPETICRIRWIFAWESPWSWESAESASAAKLGLQVTISFVEYGFQLINHLRYNMSAQSKKQQKQQFIIQIYLDEEKQQIEKFEKLELQNVWHFFLD